MTREEVYVMVSSEIALCKGMNGSLIREEMNVFDDLDVIGDDFIFLADEFHRNIHAKPDRKSYDANLTVGKWVDLLYYAQSNIKT